MGMVINQWVDQCFPDDFLSNTLALLPTVGFILGFYWSLTLILVGGLAYKMFCAAIVCLAFSTYELTFMQQVYKEKKRTVKYAFLGNQQIFGLCYYKRQLIINFDEIKKVSDLKLTLFMKEMRLFSEKASGFDIELKNGIIYHVSPYMSNLESLRQVIEDGLSRNGF